MLTTIARWFFSTPALIVAVSTRLEPRGGLLSPTTFYQKAVVERRGLYPIIFGQNSGLRIQESEFRNWYCKSYPGS